MAGKNGIDFTGFEGYAYYGDSEKGGGQEQRYNVTGGWGDLGKDKFNAFATLDRLHHHADPHRAAAAGSRRRILDSRRRRR